MVLGGLATLLLVGTTLAAGAQYSVVAGDTWESIAAAHDISVQQLADLNPVKSGEILNIPSTSSVGTTTIIASGRCMNFGYEPLSNGGYNLAQQQTQLLQLKAAGVTCLRMAFYGTNPTWAYPSYLQAKSDGFYLEIGADGTPNLSSYETGLVAEAKWAQANGIPQLTVGNEDAKNSSTQNTLAQLTCAVKQVYSGTISYDTWEEDQGSINNGKFDDIATWQKNPGCLSTFGLNSYGGESFTAWAVNKAAAAFGASHVDISETNCDVPNVSSCQSDAGLASEVKGDYMQLLQLYPNMRINFFAWQTGGDEPNTIWSVINKPLTLKALGIN